MELPSSHGGTDATARDRPDVVAIDIAYMGEPMLRTCA